jgi:hypothetical protein
MLNIEKHIWLRTATHTYVYLDSHLFHLFGQSAKLRPLCIGLHPAGFRGFSIFTLVGHYDKHCGNMRVFLFVGGVVCRVSYPRCFQAVEMGSSKRFLVSKATDVMVYSSSAAFG